MYWRHWRGVRLLEREERNNGFLPSSSGLVGCFAWRKKNSKRKRRITHRLQAANERTSSGFGDV
ncbi:hypothetical protein PAHAL_6G259000 [Panicum hallii]|uniref:Uncharacterized protein n=1 Tax=Panicum hallii TaxID=206008 RepID=A0A2S3I3U7_9POAL|nr:hypothetical protein PAHAL_6G259000 [Panicum hallii]